MGAILGGGTGDLRMTPTFQRPNHLGIRAAAGHIPLRENGLSSRQPRLTDLAARLSAAEEATQGNEEEEADSESEEQDEDDDEGEEEEEEEEEQQEENVTDDDHDEKSGQEEEEEAQQESEEEEVNESVAEDMQKLEESFKGISQQYRLINRIGEGMSQGAASARCS